MANKSESPILSETKCQDDGGIWICHTCKTVIGPIVDDDENMCGCDVYEFEHSRYIPDQSNKAQIQTLHDRIVELEGNICDECSPDDYGWKYNRVEGRHPCTCITESGAYQDLQDREKRGRELLAEAGSYVFDHAKGLWKKIKQHLGR